MKISLLPTHKLLIPDRLYGLSVMLTLALFISNTLYADQAALLEQTTLVANIANVDDPVPTRASYQSSGNFAIASPNYVDATVLVFDFGSTASVSQAILQLPLEDYYPQAGAVSLKVFAYPAFGPTDLNDFSAGSKIPVSEFDALSVMDVNGIISVNVTGVTNAILGVSPTVAYRIVSSLLPKDVTEGFPVFRGAKFAANPAMEFSPGAPPVAPGDSVNFDGHYLTLPGLSAPGVGAYNVTLRLTDSANLVFALHSAQDITTPGLIDGSSLTGTQLLDCSAFSAPPGAQALLPGAPVYSSLSGTLEIPRLHYDGKLYSAQLQLVGAGEPLMFSLNAVTELTPSSSNVLSLMEVGGSLSIQPSLDFIPLCHGWILIGDTKTNSLVERNIITGQTGRVYPFNTTPDQMMLDAANQMVYLTTQPASERLYKLNLATGTITYNLIREDGRHFVPKMLSLGEDGNIFALLFDPNYEDEADPPAENGLWMGILNTNAQPLRPSIPLDSPVRLAYDPVRMHLIGTTVSNVVSFLYDPATHELSFVPGTDIPVGVGCTDLSISPNGYRLAYSCPQGNAPEPRLSIIDMNPLDYYDADGEWNLENSPISAVFTPDGETLVATDGVKLYFFNVFNHLLRTAYTLDLPEGQTVQKVRLSRDGDLVILFISAPLGQTQGQVYWLPLPSF